MYTDMVLYETSRDIAEVVDKYTVIPYDYREDGSPVWYLGVAEPDNHGVTKVLPSAINEISYHAESVIVVSEFDSQMEFDFKRVLLEIECLSNFPETKSFPSWLVWRIGQQTNTYCDEEFLFSKYQPAIDFTGL